MASFVNLLVVFPSNFAVGLGRDHRRRAKARQLLFIIATADRYSIIRSSSSVKAADAIHLACAAESGVELFHHP
jgi:hypothetical protein